MPEIGWSELLVIAILALVVIGPKDLPRFMRMVGLWIRKARGLAREFQDSMENLAREAEFEDLRKNVESLRTANPLREVETSLRNDLRRLDAPQRGAPQLRGTQAPHPDHPTGDEEGEEAWTALEEGPREAMGRPEACPPAARAGEPPEPSASGEDGPGSGTEGGERAAARAQA